MLEGDATAIIVMGVSGCGKSTVGEALARVLGCPFIEGDHLHPPANIAKMKSGVALDDEDRWPWLDAIATEIAKPGIKVASCSALKLAYRRRLGEKIGASKLAFAHLDLAQTELENRLQKRTGHYWPQNLLPTQLAILERPGEHERNAKSFDGSQSTEILLGQIADWTNKLKLEAK